MGFARFGAVGGAGGAELTVWLKLRDEMSKRLTGAQKSMQNFQQGVAISNAKSATKISKKDIEHVKNKIARAQAAAQADIKSFDSAQTRLNALNKFRIGATKKVALAEGTYSRLAQEAIQLRARLQETSSKGEQASIRGKLSANKAAMDQSYKGVRAAQAYASQIDSVTGITQKQVDVTKMQTQAQMGMRGVFGQSVMDWKKGREGGLRYNTMSGRVADRMRGLTHGMRGFRMEMLGVMFFGMQLNKWMMGLLKPALQLTGIFDMFTATLEVLFLPVALMLMEFLMPIFDILMDLPEPVKQFIGIMVVLGAIFGAGIMLVGQFALGIGSMIIAFGALAAALPAIPAIIPLIGGVIGIISILIGTVSGAGEETEKTGNLMEDVFKSIGETFGFVFDIIGGIFGKIKKLMPKEFQFAFDAVETLVEGFLALFTGDWETAWEKIQSSIGMILEGFLPLVISMINGIIEWLKALPFIGDIIAIVSDVMDIIIGVITGDWEKVQDAFDDIIHRITKWIEWGIYIGEEMVGGIIQGLTTGFVGGITGWVGETFGTMARGAEVGAANIAKGWGEFWGGFGLQKGGIVRKPTFAMIGERGPEAVIPLGRAGIAGMGGNIIYFNPSVSISIEAATEVDIDAIKEKLSTEWLSDLKGMLEG